MKRLMMKTSTVAAAAALTALLAGCNLAPRYQTPQGAVPDTVTAEFAPSKAMARSAGASSRAQM